MSDAPEVTFTLALLEEDFEPDFEDPQTLEWVEEQRRSGNEWAWFCAGVTARMDIEGVVFTGTDYLGGCSYEGEESFRQRDGYWPDLLSQALDSLKQELDRAMREGELEAPVEPVLRALALAQIDIELYRRGLWVRGPIPTRLIDLFGLPFFLGDKKAGDVFVDALLDRGSVTDERPRNWRRWSGAGLVPLERVNRVY